MNSSLRRPLECVHVCLYKLQTHSFLFKHFRAHALPPGLKPLLFYLALHEHVGVGAVAFAPSVAPPGLAHLAAVHGGH